MTDDLKRHIGWYPETVVDISENLCRASTHKRKPGSDSEVCAEKWELKLSPALTQIFDSLAYSNTVRQVYALKLVCAKSE